ncbi:MAG: hypothetical protein ACJKTH_02865 [Patescibacteria group bacterium UBA2163]
MDTSDLGGTLQYLLDLIVDFSSDFFAFIVVAAAIAAFAFYFGRNRIVPLTAALYAAIPLYMQFPYMEYITTPLLHIALYLGITALALVAFSNLASFVAEGSIGFIKLVTLSASVAGLLLAVSIHVLPVEDIYTFSAATRALFAPGEAFFLWLVLPLAGIFVLGRG